MLEDIGASDKEQRTQTKVMSRVMDFAKGLFRRTGKPEVHVSSDVLRGRFKSRYGAFKALLEANNKTLEIIATMERVLGESQSFGMSFIRANCTAMSVNVYKIITNMNTFSPVRYGGLFDVFEAIGARIAKILDEQKEIIEGDWILPLEEVHRDMADQVGGKMANLGEIRNRVGLAVPEGFVITASAYRDFLTYNNLQEEINRLMQPLDLENMEMLHKASASVQLLITKSPLRPELQEHIMSAYRCLEEKNQKGVNLSVRSSALGEDTEQRTFAGQYRSNLNVSRKFLADAYREVLASKYSPQALLYRLNMGFRDEDIAMSVGCMAMVDAVSSGVMYSRDPGDIRNQVVVINAVWGLAKSIVDGTVSPDLFVVSRKIPRQVVKREIRTKDCMFVCLPGEGTCHRVLTGDHRDKPAITERQATILAGLATDIENHFGGPQDIEWAIGTDGQVRILQSRPLKQVDIKAAVGHKTVDATISQPLVLEGGVTASPGVSSGPAFLVNNMVDALQFPSGAVLVTQHSLPQWAALLNRAVALVTDRGGIAGHLATVSREFSIPALFNTMEATAKIQHGTVITVDADGKKVYNGKVDALIKEASSKRANLMKGSPVYHVLERVLEFISPLNLTDPTASNFMPKGCQTYHDITRFCHEKSVKEMFDFGKEHHFPERSSKQLVCQVPMQWWVINLEDGFKEPVHGKTVNVENISSIPMLALWEGITAVPWEGPPPVDAKGFLSVMFRSTMDPSLDPTRRSRYADKNYFMISKHFCNLASRLGFHFSTIEAFVGDNPGENYVSFNFKGGGADLRRRVLRLRIIEHILKKFAFRTEINEDCIMARLEGHDEDFVVERLKVLGYVSIHTRQLDMVMANQSVVDRYIEQHLKDICSFVSAKLN